jgi:hypothetical protein
LAERQHGVVSRRQLVAAGFSRQAIEHRLENGRLHIVRRGIYAVGRPQLTPKGRWMAAILACGDEAMLSHRSAAALWGIAREGSEVEVTVRRGDPRPRGLRVHNRPSLADAEIGTRYGIPVTSPARTLLDLASELRPIALERAVNEADKRDLIDPVSLRKTLEGRGGQPGVRALRRLLERDTFLLSDSDLEILFRPLAVAAGLPPPLSRQLVNGFEVDFHWPGLGLVVETDGLRYHRTASAQRRDRIRDQTHTAAGNPNLRFTHWQIVHDRAHVIDVLRRTVAPPPLSGASGAADKSARAGLGPSSSGDAGREPKGAHSSA